MNEVSSFVGESKTDVPARCSRPPLRIESAVRSTKRSIDNAGATMTPARVLLIGNERAHLEARAAVLHHFWHVELAPLAESELPVFSADLVVVCHTLPEAERQHWVLTVRHQFPSILIVRMNGFESGPHGGADATVDVEAGPGSLVSTLYELLTERGIASKRWPEVPTTCAIQ